MVNNELVLIALVVLVNEIYKNIIKIQYFSNKITKITTKTYDREAAQNALY